MSAIRWIVKTIVDEGLILPEFEIYCKKSMGLEPESKKDGWWAETIQLTVIKDADINGSGDEYELVAGITLNTNDPTPYIHWLGVYHRRLCGKSCFIEKDVKTLYLSVGEHLRTLICPELTELLNSIVKEYVL